MAKNCDTVLRKPRFVRVNILKAGMDEVQSQFEYWTNLVFSKHLRYWLFGSRRDKTRLE